ncbi:DUF3574 domain-containing protein [Gluconacetobacter tumulisoli]|uniref:DUF3574 domain-containing protein n=1 Tax=Gluconacetobacter tumulisoli TaxID=1286189 RepID=A0A7W4K9N9_9PROT|nr:DUF3574 domain-containing protein [Gluconacetobacter tumulisoli]MBB2202875.1 DUF3574 domain-containing protein [Gluconacetobacter tumulisoli]
MIRLPGAPVVPAALPAVLLVLAMAGSVGDCAPARPACAGFGARPGLELSLMFGLTRPDGTPVTDAQWDGFMRQEITPRFPDGLSVFRTVGQWRDRENGRIVAEPSRIVWIAAPGDTPDLRAHLEAIRDLYRRDFQQQSVGLTIRAGCQAF